MELNSGEKYSFSDLIEYKEGSIISTRIRNNKSVSITLFSFASGQELTEHTAPHEAMVQVLDGSSLITIEDKSFNLHAGDMIILPPSIPHAVHANGPFCMLLTIIKE